MFNAASHIDFYFTVIFLINSIICLTIMPYN